MCNKTFRVKKSATDYEVRRQGMAPISLWIIVYFLAKFVHFMVRIFIEIKLGFRALKPNKIWFKIADTSAIRKLEIMKFFNNWFLNILCIFNFFYKTSQQEVVHQFTVHTINFLTNIGHVSDVLENFSAF